MEQVKRYQQEELAAASFSPAFFDDFLFWIDRGEKTTRTYLKNLRQFAAWLKYEGITQPTRADVIAFRRWLLSEHEAIALAPDAAQGWTYRTDRSGEPLLVTCSPNTAAQYLRSVCQLFRWTAASGLYPDIAANIHAPKIKHDAHRKDALTVREVAAVERSITNTANKKIQTAQQAKKDTEGRTRRSEEQGKRILAIFLLAVNAGLRTVEISRANVKDLETKGGDTVLYVWGKGHTEPDQRKPLAPEVARAVRDYLASRQDRPTGASPLFVATGNRSGGKRLAATTISTMLKKAMQDAGFDSDRLTAHSLRHSCGTAIMEMTGNIYEAQIYMRHSNPATTEIYLHNDTQKTEADLARRLYDLYHEADPPYPEGSSSVPRPRGAGRKD